MLERKVILKHTRPVDSGQIDKENILEVLKFRRWCTTAIILANQCASTIRALFCGVFTACCGGKISLRHPSEIGTSFHFLKGRNTDPPLNCFPLESVRGAVVS